MDIQKKKTKKKLTVRQALFIYGVFTITALVLSIFTHQISVNENMLLFFDSESMLQAHEIKDFLIFIFFSAAGYFLIINRYFKID